MINWQWKYILVGCLILFPSIWYFFDSTGSFHKEYVEPMVLMLWVKHPRHYDDISLYQSNYEECIIKWQSGSMYLKFLDTAKLAWKNISSATGEKLDMMLKKLSQLWDTKETFIEENNRSIVKFQSLYDWEMDDFQKNCKQYSIEWLSAEAKRFYIILMLMGLIGWIIIWIENWINLIRISRSNNL